MCPCDHILSLTPLRIIPSTHSATAKSQVRFWSSYNKRPMGIASKDMDVMFFTAVPFLGKMITKMPAFRVTHCANRPRGHACSSSTLNAKCHGTMSIQSHVLLGCPLALSSARIPHSGARWRYPSYFPLPGAHTSLSRSFFDSCICFSICDLCSIISVFS